MYDIIFSCEQLNIDGLILLIDFEKAFDSLSWEFIGKTLEEFNFGENFRKWVNLFQSKSNSRVILNGHLSQPFLLHRGCRQGDPISPYLFILCSEYLTLAFKNTNTLEGINIRDKEYRISQYADDTSNFLKATEENLKNRLKIMDWFYHKSGLKINYSKTKVIRIGPIRETDRRFCRENDLEWVTSFTALGIDYDTLNINEITDQNISLKIESMKKLIQLWMGRNITPVGRITVFKSLVLSKIIHLLQSLPSPSHTTLKSIEKMALKFIWRNKRHQVSKKTLTMSLEKGGLQWVDLLNFDRSLKITWLRKIQDGAVEWLDFAKLYKIDRLIWTGENYHQLIIKEIKNPFWVSVAKSYKEWFKLLNKQIYPTEFQPIWGNPMIRIPFNNTLYLYL